MTTTPMFAPVLSQRWTVQQQQLMRSRVLLRLDTSGPRFVDVTLSRVLAGPLRDAYPVSAHDVRLEVDATALDATELVDLLRELVDSVEREDPQCRRVVYSVPADDLAAISTGESAGFRFVVEVEVEGAVLALLVAEPDWVTRVDMDLERVPGS